MNAARSHTDDPLEIAASLRARARNWDSISSSIGEEIAVIVGRTKSERARWKRLYREAKANVALVWLVSAGGPERMAAAGGMPSIVQAKNAGEETLPARSAALTAKVWLPWVRGP